MVPNNPTEAARRGELLAKVFQLKPDPEHKDRYLTEWGTKTALGVYLTAKRIIETGKQYV